VTVRALHADAVERPDFRDYLRPILTRWWLVLLIVGIATAGTYVYSERRPKEYESATSLYVSNPVTDKILFGTGTAPTDRDVANVAALITSLPVARAAAQETGYRGPARDLLGNVIAKPAADSDFITVTATGPTAAQASDRANAFARTFIALREQQQRRDARAAIGLLRRQITSLPGGSAARSQRSQLQQKIDQLQVVTAANTTGAGVQQINVATPPASATSPEPVRNAVFAFVVGLAMAVAAAFALERLDTRITTIRDLVGAYGLPVLAEVPKARRRLRRARRRRAALSPPFREPMRRLRMAVEVASAEQPIRTLLVTSATPGEGKSTVLSQLALAYGASDQRVLIADTDLRKPNLDALLRVNREPGLTEVLSGTCSLDEVVQSLSPRTASVGAIAAGKGRTPVDGGGPGNGMAGGGELSVIASGRASESSLELLGSQRMRGILDVLETQYDIILLDSPPLLAVADAVPLISRVDAVLVVAQLGHSTWDAAERLTEELSRVASARVLGVVANAVPVRQQRSGSYAYR
jgi:Mrp family chromosome partitioning ATPase/capsular polysaccharide biosynthesis protein